ncbi:hypothetical protein QBC35DRAFT_498775 [Podospora australis]|uniref:Apple domain-containing protein n=1 Tax=Podospora australis TaxID=1536484 RepID=A0AAN6WSP8_9PEZI|nr:hypothetical protein QBC35DRAFT_498775 [Podospora australis]
MDSEAPEALSGPTKSLSYIFRRNHLRIQTPPPFSPRKSPLPYSPRRSSMGMYTFSTSKRTEKVQELVGGKVELEAPPEPTIWGLRPPTFFLSLALTVLVVTIIIGGSWGGIAVANARREAACQTILIPTVTVTPGPGGVSRTPTATIAPDLAGTPTALAAISVPTTGLLDFDCGRIAMNRQVITLGKFSWGFDVNCMMDFIGPGVDLTGMTTYTFDDCIRACAIFNKQARNNTCVGVHFNANLTTILPKVHGNCWLKGYLPVMSPEMDLAAVATLAFQPKFSN